MLPSIVRVTQLGILTFVSVGVLYTTKCLLQLLVFWLSSMPLFLWAELEGFHAALYGESIARHSLSVHLDPVTLAVLGGSSFCDSYRKYISRLLSNCAASWFAFCEYHIHRTSNVTFQSILSIHASNKNHTVLLPRKRQH